MHICEICKRSFNTNQGLVSHLTFPKSTCKINIKDYYDKFIRTSNEGVCKYCGGETNFLGLSKGYPANICGKCNNENKDSDKNIKRSKSIKETLRKKRLLKEARLSLVDFLRKQTIDKNNKNQCQICGLIFNNYRSLMLHIKIHKTKAKDYYDTYFKTKNEDICLCFGEVESCKKYTKFISFKDGYLDYCSTKCLSNSPLVYEEKKENSIKKYGVSHPTKDPDINKRQVIGILKTLAERKDEMAENRKKTVMKKYGVEFISQAKEVKEKSRNTWKQKKETSEYTEARQQMYHTFLENTFLPRLEIILEKQDLELLEEYKGAHLPYKFKCKKCGSVFKNLWNSVQQGVICKVCNGGKSKAEIELVSWFKRFDVEFVENDRSQITPYELDIFIPSMNIAIEYCGLYYHSELVCKTPKSYHKYKLDLCNKNGIRLIHVFEDEWKYKKNIVKKRIEHILGFNKATRIHARKCSIKEINSKEKNKFLELTHLQGGDSSTIKLGAFYGEKLISVMTFSKGNISKGSKVKYGIWELNRFSSDCDFIIPGIASKLLSYFKRNYSWKKIYSYADLRWSNGNLYNKLGFDLVYQTKPNYWYFKNYKRIHRFNLRKRPDEPKDIPEWILRHEQGYFRIWDCGHLKFEMINKEI